MKTVWEQVGNGHQDTRMLWAACCTAFFAFLRVGEFTVPSANGYDPAVHLNLGDVAFNHPSKPTMARITIKKSKTDQLREGVDLFVGKTASPLCPVGALLDFLRVRGKSPGPLFIHQDGRALTRAKFAEEIRAALRKAGVDQSTYCTRSFRKGAASTAAAKGVEDSVIKTLGRWKGLAYLQYISVAREHLADYSRRLAE